MPYPSFCCVLVHISGYFHLSAGMAVLTWSVSTVINVEDTMRAIRTPGVTLRHDDVTGMRAVIAIDDTTLGPALGGVRWMPYPDMDAAVTEACRLARGMTLKNALAELPYGGAKSVILSQDGEADRA
jgi:glutamate dehydrogenase/leucine dehydrogenase